MRLGKRRRIVLEPPRYRVYTRKDIDSIPQLKAMPAEWRLQMKAVSAVLPFRVNRYVLDELIDWDEVPHDPMYQLTVPQSGMLAPSDRERMVDLVRRGAPEPEVQEAAREIQMGLNAHPAGQQDLNVPRAGDVRLEGTQHKYRDTLLFFPSQGQTCHAYCTYCFRWAQFVGMNELKFATREIEGLVAYLKAHPEVTDVLFTGGDPMVMKARVLRSYVDAILQVDHIQTIRIGTKAPAYWPYRFVTDPDADELLGLFEEVIARGRQLAVMAHYSHPRELAPEIAKEAVRRIRGTGAVMRSQAPLIRHVNDGADIWADLWRQQVALGIVPYYMFVERDTGPRHYFEVPLARAHRVFVDALSNVTGLARTVRGPSMSATPGKVLVDGVTTIGHERVFVLKMLRARDPEWVGEIFFARYDPKASWMDDLEPALGAKEFFYEQPLEAAAAALR